MQSQVSLYQNQRIVLVENNMASQNYLTVSRSSSRRSSISSVAEDKRASNFDALRQDVNEIKDLIRRLYRQVDSYDEKRLHLTESLENLKRANKDYEMKVRDLLDVFKNPPASINVSSFKSKVGSRVGLQSYESNVSSRSSSRNEVNVAVFDDDYEDDSSYDDYPDERNFTKSVENIDDESSEA